MGNKFSKKNKDTIKCIINLDPENKKKVVAKIDNFICLYDNAYVFFKPQKKINYLKYNNVNLEIKEVSSKPGNYKYQDFELLHNLVNDTESTIETSRTNSKIFDISFNMRQNLEYNQISDKLYLEKKIVNSHNNYSIKIRINPENNLLEQILFILPTHEFHALKII